MKAGESVLIECDNCDASFEITYMPECDDPDGWAEAEVQYCPACGRAVARDE